MAAIKLQRNIYIVLFAISVLMTILIVIVSVTGTAGTDESIFKSPWMVLIFALFAAGLYFVKKEKASIGIWAIAVGANAVIVMNNWLVNGYVPFVSMY